MKKKTCEKCKYFEEGKCHRFPPQLIPLIKERKIPSFFPGVFSIGWCGEFKKRSLFTKKKSGALPSIRVSREPPVSKPRFLGSEEKK